jgi:hypothetical protein
MGASLPLTRPWPLLVAALVLSLAACSGSGGTDRDALDDNGTVEDVSDPGPGSPDARDGTLPDIEDHGDSGMIDLDPGLDIGGDDPGWDPGPDGADVATDPGEDYGPQGPVFFLVQDGASAHVLVLADDASPSERQAAQDLQALFLEATGVELPMVAAAESPDTPRIVIGQGDAARALGVDPDPVDLGDQGYVLKAIPPHVVIAGTPKAGTMYGVHRFLEEALGVRWIAPGVTIVPHSSDVTFPEDEDRKVHPAFFWRSTRYAWPGGDSAFLARQAENDGGAGVDDPFGVQYGNDGQAHSYFWYVSPDEFFDSHPEYFSEIGGVRIRDETQLCLTNPDVLDITTERMLARMAARPNVRQHNFSQKDYYNYCQCDACSAMNALYETAGGTQFWFVNELAKRTSQVYPDKLIGTLAYMYTEEPPQGLEMHPNVAVWLCHMYPSCDSHPIRTCPKNADYKRRAEAWSGLTPHLYIWHYIVDFMHYYVPFPNFGAMAEDMRFYRDIGVEGMFLQGMSHSGGGGEFSLLRPWYGMKLLWNPDQDGETLIRRWLKDYYGAAWGPIRDWIALLQDKVDREQIHMHLYTNPAQGYLPDSIVRQGEALFDEAAALVADDPELLDRVQVARMPLFYARFFPRNGYRIEDGWLRWNPGQATFDELLDFIDQLNAHGFKSIREAEGSPDTLVMMYAMLGVDQEVKTIRNALLEVDVVPALAGRALRITDRATGKVVAAHDRRANLFFPFAGGLEDRVGEGFNFFGWVEPGNASSVTEQSLTVSLKTFDGLNLSRKLALDPDQPILRIETTVTNPGPGARDVRLRNHFEMDLGDLATTRVTFTRRDGTPVDRNMGGVIAGMREGEHYYDQEAPAGEWTFSGSKGLELTHRFEDSAVDFAWLYAYPEELNELEWEVWAKRATLQAGESVTLRHEIEVRAAP